jgi:hypothetical protein
MMIGKNVIITDLSQFYVPTIGKIFEKEVFDQLYEHLSQNLLLSKYQSGFRSKHSTMSALIHMCDQWLENMDNGMLNCVVFIDIRKGLEFAGKLKTHNISFSTRKRCTSLSRERDNSRVPQSPSKLYH